jgi:hypothetical protein
MILYIYFWYFGFGFVSCCKAILDCHFICVYYHCVIRYEVGFFGYCSFSALVPFVLLGVCFTTLSIYCVITIVRKFGVIWIHRSCFIKLLLFWQLVFQI